MTISTSITGDHKNAAANDKAQKETAKAITDMPKAALRAAVAAAVEKAEKAEKKS